MWREYLVAFEVPRKSPREVHRNPEDLTEGERTVRLFGTNSPKKEAV
jgi:hypothetical protein